MQDIPPSRIRRWLAWVFWSISEETKGEWTMLQTVHRLETTAMDEVLVWIEFEFWTSICNVKLLIQGRNVFVWNCSSFNEQLCYKPGLLPFLCSQEEVHSSNMFESRQPMSICSVVDLATHVNDCDEWILLKWRLYKVDYLLSWKWEAIWRPWWQIACKLVLKFCCKETNSWGTQLPDLRRIYCIKATFALQMYLCVGDAVWDMTEWAECALELKSNSNIPVNTHEVPFKFGSDGSTEGQIPVHNKKKAKQRNKRRWHYCRFAKCCDV